MGYKIFYNGGKVKVYSDDELCKIQHYTKEKHIWPEDTTTISFSISGDTLTYSLTNMSDRTQYLLNTNQLGLGLFVEENPRWLNWKWRSSFAKDTHALRRCHKVWKITSASGTINLSNVWSWAGAISHQLTCIFYYATDYSDPYRSSGTENVCLGVGRFYDNDENSYAIACFRPHKVSSEIEITVYNSL